MQDLVIRPLAPSDIPAVSVAATSVGWSELEERLQYYLPMPQAQTLIVTYGEDPIGSGTAIAKGPVGWLGAVFIHPDYQGRGYGTLLTQALVAWLEERGCVSQALAATSEGERVYRKLGFSAESTYTVFGGRTLTQVPYHQYLRPLTDSDLNSVVELDRWATGEDRSRFLYSFGARGWLLPQPRDHIAAALVISPWHSAAILSRTVRDGKALLDLRLSDRSFERPDGTTIVTVPSANTAAIAHLRRRGFVALRQTLRMVRGSPLVWHPSGIWSVINFHLG